MMPRRKRIWLKAIVTALGLLLFSYVATNIDTVLGGEGDLIRNANILRSLFIDDDSSVPDSILLVNICYDKQLITINDEDGFCKGNIDITNREALLDFLMLLSVHSDYKFVFLDVFFEKGFDSDVDSLLFAKILTMEHVIIPYYHDAELSDSCLIKNAGLSDYVTTLIDDDFRKYVLSDNGHESVALKMYQEVTGNRIKKFGPFYFDGNSLCNNAIFSRQEVQINAAYNADGSKNYYNLSEDLLIDEEGVVSLAKGKYIIIGDMELEDIHSTVQGDLPGSVITTNAFITLMRGNHKIPVSVVLFLFFVFLLFALSIYSNRSISCLLMSWMRKSHPRLAASFVVTIISLISYSFILSSICLLCFFIKGISYDILLTATLLQCIDYIESKIHKQ